MGSSDNMESLFLYLDTFGYVRIRDRNMIKIYDPGEDGKKDAKGRKHAVLNQN